MAQLVLKNPGAWTQKPVDTPAGRRSAQALAGFPERFLADGVSIADEQAYEPAAGRRSISTDVIELSVSGRSGEQYVLAVRHASGALTFHEPQAAAPSGRRSATASYVFEFRVEVRASGRRGVVGRALRAILLKVADVVLGAALPVLVKKWEERKWRREKRREQFVRFDEAGLAAGRLDAAVPQVVPTPSGRALLLLPGTFSETIGSFGGLQQTAFFSEAQKRYGAEIFGFDHFSLSKTPEENARDLLAALPDKAPVFDVVTYSRGGLVLRQLSERLKEAGAKPGKFKLGRVVLVASPNAGTPLATPSRWKETVGWLATLLDHFPDTPFTTGAAFVAEAITWIAARAVDAAPGLDAMDGAGEHIATLRNSRPSDPDAYAALIANYEPEDGLVRKMLDAGIDAFFAGTNDLVVPTEGGWRGHAQAEAPLVNSARVMCFGRGGNAGSAAGVHHLNFFSRPETSRFILAALAGEDTGLAPYDAAGRRSANADSGERPVGEMVRPAAVAAAAATETVPRVYSDSLHLTVLNSGDAAGAIMYAQYAGARVIEPFRTKGGDAGQRWQKIIRHDREIRNYIAGRNGASLPTDDALRSYGRILFETLFPGDIRRLYDIARSREAEPTGQGGAHLNVIFTSRIPWVADIPWEFAYDESRRTFLATEEVRFIRNAMTTVPAERLRGERSVLRILVASAQPVGAGRLSIDQENAVILRGFEHLVAEGLAEIVPLANATPAALHEKLISEPFDILHFIGHGEFDLATDSGYLLFEGPRGETIRLAGRDLRALARGRGLQMVFLNACETGVRGRSEFNQGIAPELMDTGIHCVIANQYSVLDSSASEFAQVFYWMIAQGATIGAAAREARIALNYSVSGESIDWAVPVVYARNPESRLTAPRAASPGMTLLASNKQMRRRTGSAKIVGVWDINSLFPELQATLARLNEVQSDFFFERVEASLPLGAVQPSEDGDRQLNADIAARRLKQMPQTLGADILYGISRHLISFEDDDFHYYNHYNWWPDDKSQGAILLASAWHPDLPATGQVASRVVANLLVQGLSAFLSGESTHKRGPEDCPLYYEENLLLDLLMGEQRFDATCEARLSRKLGSEFQSLRALLRTFDD